MKYTLPLLLWAALFTACTQDEADIPQNPGGHHQSPLLGNRGNVQGCMCLLLWGWNCGKCCMEWKQQL